MDAANEEPDMAEHETGAKPEANVPPLPTLEEMQHWTWVMGRAQQMMMEHVAKSVGEMPKVEASAFSAAGQWPMMNMFPDAAKLARQQMEMWSEGLAIWQRAL